MEQPNNIIHLDSRRLEKIENPKEYFGKYIEQRITQYVSAVSGDLSASVIIHDDSMSVVLLKDGKLVFNGYSGSVPATLPNDEEEIISLAHTTIQSIQNTMDTWLENRDDTDEKSVMRNERNHAAYFGSSEEEGGRQQKSA